MGKAIGIDLGTTNSVMAILRGDRPITLENIDGKRLTPSVVGISRDDERLVGELAKAQAVLRPRDTIFSIKRFMGRNFRDPDVQRDIEMAPYKVTAAENDEVEVWLGGKTYSPPDRVAFPMNQVLAVLTYNSVIAAFRLAGCCVIHQPFIANFKNERVSGIKAIDYHRVFGVALPFFKVF